MYINTMYTTSKNTSRCQVACPWQTERCCTGENDRFRMFTTSFLYGNNILFTPIGGRMLKKVHVIYVKLWLYKFRTKPRIY